MNASTSSSRKMARKGAEILSKMEAACATILDAVISQKNPMYAPYWSAFAINACQDISTAEAPPKFPGIKQVTLSSELSSEAPDTTASTACHWDSHPQHGNPFPVQTSAAMAVPGQAKEMGVSLVQREHRDQTPHQHSSKSLLLLLLLLQQ